MTSYKDNAWILEQKNKLFSESGLSDDEFNKQFTFREYNVRRCEKKNRITYGAYQYWLDENPVFHSNGDVYGFGLMPWILRKDGVTVCAVCGEKGTNFAFDTAELASDEDGLKQGLMVGDPRCMCDDHCYSLHYRLDGTIELNWSSGDDDEKAVALINPNLPNREMQDYKECKECTGYEDCKKALGYKETKE